VSLNPPLDAQQWAQESLELKAEVPMDRQALPAFPQVESPGSDVLLKVQQVMAITGLSRSSIYSYMRAGMFPLPATVGGRAVRWSLIEVRCWIAERFALRDAQGRKGRGR
jgi:prophage regulatory protein